MGFVEESWLEILSITFSMLALAISLWSLYIKRLDLQRERLAREVTFGPVDAEVVIDREAIENADPMTVQLINDTGIQQIASEVWVRVESMPREVSDEQYARFRDLLIALIETGLRVLGRGELDAGVEQRVDQGVLRNKYLYLLALLYVILERVRSGGEHGISVDSSFYRLVEGTSDNLDELVAMMADPDNEWIVRRMLTPTIVAMFREHIGTVLTDGGYCLGRSLRVSVPPTQIKNVDVEITRFANRLYDVLDLIGGEYNLLCRLCCKVHKGERMSESELFLLRLRVEPMDISPIMAHVERELKGRASDQSG